MGFTNIGSKTKVMNGTSNRTAGGLRKGDIVRTADGKRWTSRRQQAHGRRMMRRNGLVPGSPARMAELRSMIRKKKRKSRKAGKR